MKLVLQSTVILLLLVSCSGRKQVERNLHRGNYDSAINDALNRLSTNKDANRKQDFIALLADAFIKAEARDLDNINQLKKDGNPEHYLGIYNTYIKLHQRQESIKPVLPLTYKGKEIKLKFRNYDEPINTYKSKASEQLYIMGLKLLKNENKSNVREAYRTFESIEAINPNYKDVRNLMEDAYNRGTNYVFVSVINDTYHIIPGRLENELLNFDTYGLNDFWTVYHAQKTENVKYDYELNLLLNTINISPERILNRQFLRENKIVDGTDYEYDRNGNVKKDSLGNDIKIDKIVTIKARVTEFEQLKSSQILGQVEYVDIKSNSVINTYPINSEFIFSNVYATFRGDERALSIDDKNLIRNRQVFFPTNEQMVFDTGEDLKLKFKEILKSLSYN